MCIFEVRFFKRTWFRKDSVLDAHEFWKERCYEQTSSRIELYSEAGACQFNLFLNTNLYLLFLFQVF